MKTLAPFFDIDACAHMHLRAFAGLSCQTFAHWRLRGWKELSFVALLGRLFHDILHHDHWHRLQNPYDRGRWEAPQATGTLYANVSCNSRTHLAARRKGDGPDGKSTRANVENLTDMGHCGTRTISYHHHRILPWRNGIV